MSTAVLRDGFWPVAAGFCVACVALVTLQATKSIAPPSIYVAWFNCHEALHIGRMLWDLLVVGSLGLGLPAFVGAVRGSITT